MKQRTILITNDDGINAPGIIQLVKAAKKFGEVWIVAPEGQRSAISHKITYSDSIDVKKVPFPVDGVHAFSCTGTPTDCVRLGILKILKTKPDIIFSGINEGYNIAADIQYSGTAAAAFEASFLGFPAIAFSQDSVDTHPVTDKYIDQIIEAYISKPLGKNQIWNVNFPSCSVQDCKGILENRTVSQDGFYIDDYSEEILEDGSHRFIVQPARDWTASEGTDLQAVHNNYISIGIAQNIQ